MQAGLLDTHHRAISTRGLMAVLVSLLLTAFYLLLYLPGSTYTPDFPDFLSPIAAALHLPDKWFLYGALYTLGMVVGGGFMLRKHGNSRYHRLRTVTLVAVQILFAFSLPLVMRILGHPDYYLSYFWPLSYDKLFPGTLAAMPGYIAAWFVIGSLVAMPALAYFKGKRVYCSWICGCGGLAETFGDPWRHLSDKSPRAWRFEQFSVYGVLALVLVTTGLMIADAAGAAGDPTLKAAAQSTRGFYSFFVGAMFSGVLGVGLYPLMGSRVWCRFGCPMAAVLGLIQKFGRFRITTKKDMCISCGNCSTYCEMGIDVRAYAMNNLDIKRASCVGCGMCAHVCPRGVLKLENRRDVGPGAPTQEWTLDL
jgi:ferredoxin-type protein NapH